VFLSNCFVQFKQPVIDKREVRLKYEADQKKFKEGEAKKRKVGRDGLGPGQYFSNVLDIPGLTKCSTVKHSFGNTARPPTHAKGPKHLQYKKYDAPGPGYYAHKDESFRSKSKNIMQTNWSRAGRNWSALPKKNPGPGKYEHNPPAHRTQYNKHGKSVNYQFPGYKIPEAAREDPATTKRVK
jgi:hypothetical protein